MGGRSSESENARALAATVLTCTWMNCSHPGWSHVAKWPRISPLRSTTGLQGGEARGSTFNGSGIHVWDMGGGDGRMTL